MRRSSRNDQRKTAIPRADYSRAADASSRFAHTGNRIGETKHDDRRSVAVIATALERRRFRRLLATTVFKQTGGLD